MSTMVAVGYGPKRTLLRFVASFGWVEFDPQPPWSSVSGGGSQGVATTPDGWIFLGDEATPGRMRHYNPNTQTWSAFTVPGFANPRCYAIGAADKDNVWAGISDKVFHFDGVEYTQVLDANSPIYEVWVYNTRCVWVVAGAGTASQIWEYNPDKYGGSGWYNHKSDYLGDGGQDSQIMAVWGLSPSEVYIGNNSDRIWKYDGNSWSEVIQISGNVKSIWGTASDNIYALDNQLERLWWYNGTLWQNLNGLYGFAPTQGSPVRVKGSANRVFVVTRDTTACGGTYDTENGFQNSILYRYDRPAQSTYGLYDVAPWNTDSSDPVVENEDPAPDEEGVDPYTTIQLDVYDEAGAGGAIYHAVSLESGAAKHWIVSGPASAPVRRTPVAMSTANQRPNGIWVFGDEIWVTGYGYGSVPANATNLLRSVDRGDNWTQEYSRLSSLVTPSAVQTGTPYGVGESAPGNLFVPTIAAEGAGGRVYRSPDPMDSNPFTISLQGPVAQDAYLWVHGNGLSDIWALSSSNLSYNTVQHFNGTTWIADTALRAVVGTFGTVHGVWVDSNGKVYVAVTTWPAVDACIYSNTTGPNGAWNLEVNLETLILVGDPAWQSGSGQLRVLHGDKDSGAVYALIGTGGRSAIVKRNPSTGVWTEDYRIITGTGGPTCITVAGENHVMCWSDSELVMKDDTGWYEDHATGWGTISAGWGAMITGASGVDPDSVIIRVNGLTVWENRAAQLDWRGQEIELQDGFRFRYKLFPPGGFPKGSEVEVQVDATDLAGNPI